MIYSFVSGGLWPWRLLFFAGVIKNFFPVCIMGQTCHSHQATPRARGRQSSCPRCCTPPSASDLKVCGHLCSKKLRDDGSYSTWVRYEKSYYRSCYKRLMSSWAARRISHRDMIKCSRVHCEILHSVQDDTNEDAFYALYTLISNSRYLTWIAVNSP